MTAEMKALIQRLASVRDLLSSADRDYIGIMAIEKGDAWDASYPSAKAALYFMGIALDAVDGAVDAMKSIDPGKKPR